MVNKFQPVGCAPGEVPMDDFTAKSAALGAATAALMNLCLLFIPSALLFLQLAGSLKLAIETPKQRVVY